MSIIEATIGHSFRWVDELFVTPLSFTDKRVSLGVWLAETVLDAQQWIERLQRIHCEGNCYWFFPSGGPRMLAVNISVGQRVSYGNTSHLSIHDKSSGGLTVHFGSRYQWSSRRSAIGREWLDKMS